MAKAKALRAAPRLTKEDRKWRARDDLRTLQAVAEIKSDPRRLQAAQSEAKAQLAALAKVTKT